MNRRKIFKGFTALLGLSAAPWAFSQSKPTAANALVLSEAQWKQKLSPAQFAILRTEGTERAGSSPLNNEKRKGVYHCAGCDLALFTSEMKFDSGTGWPSFFQPVDEAHVGRIHDRSYGMVRTEIVCARCQSHLGHVFPDGPPPTGERHCLNSVSLAFTPNGEALPDPLQRGGAEAQPAG